MKKVQIFAILSIKWQRVKVSPVQVSLDEVTFMLVPHEHDEKKHDNFTNACYNHLRDG